MSPLFVLIVLFNLTYIVHTNEVTYLHKSRHLLRAIPPQRVDEDASNNNAQPEVDPIVVNKHDQTAKSQPKVEKPEEIKKTNGTPPTPVKNETKVEGVEHIGFNTNDMESGALLRGVSVVVILTTLVIIYMALKTYCGKRGKSPVMVSKYGVRARRSDIEMTPLPLSEDEDDETLFDVNTTNR